ncbi:MAG: [Fe-Fe] hydrogenase large subunit C-terminal domain-containing protein [Christensenellales bacterium]|jgi:iron only hydrogenase large subunit-like protein
MRTPSYIISHKSECKDCYKCIRNCPVKAISFEMGQAQIIDSECILCGNCYVVCPQDAKEVRTTLDTVKAAIAAGRRAVASVAPSFVAAFDAPNIAGMRDALIRLGFSDAQETALGAQRVSREYEDIAKHAGGRAIISSACPSINLLIQMYYPDMTGNLATVVTPMHAHCLEVKKSDPEAYTVFIGPCVAKKREADETDCVDACLTFDELKAWLDEAGVSVGDAQAEDGEGARARFYPTAGGIIKSMNETPGYSRVAIDGVENCMSALDEIREGGMRYVFIEMSACEGSCINGPIMREHAKKRVSGMARVSRYAGHADFDLEGALEIGCAYPEISVRRVLPGGRAIQAVLDQMGKTSPERELNCGSCGYPTCRDKAIAVCRGKADIGMCLPFLKEKAESFSDKIIENTPNAIIVMDEDLIVQQINTAAVRMLKLRSAHDILNAPVVRLLNPVDYLKVATTGNDILNKCHYIAEYGIFVEESIIADKRYRILISIMRDVTSREVGRRADEEIKQRTAEVTNQVIENQMRVVQEITSLLGETTAQTKVALTKLKDAMMDGE